MQTRRLGGRYTFPFSLFPCLLTARPPDPPLLTFISDSPSNLELAPVEPIDATAAEAAFSTLGSAARHRLEEVETIESAVRAIESAERAVRDAERAMDTARSANEEARDTLDGARAAFQSAAAEWRASVERWMDRLRFHHSAHEIGTIETPADIDGLVSEVVLGHRMGTRFDAWIAPAIRHHEGRRAHRVALLDRQRELVAELEERAADLAKKQFPEPPILGWQRRSTRCFAELIDFAGHVDTAARAGLEPALEASGLLAAELHGDGTLRLADGQFLVMADASDAAAPLRALLCPEIPADHPNSETEGVIERILRAISTDPAAITDTVIATDGEFRIGLVRGKHTKPEAELVGLTARRAALERQRAESALALEQAQAHQSQLSADVDAAQTALDEALALRQNIPSDETLCTALWRRGEAQRILEKIDEQLLVRSSELEAVEQRHAEAVTRARVAAAQLSLPTVLDELRFIRGEIEAIIPQIREARGELGRLTRSVERWRERSADWRAARADEQQSRTHLTSVSTELGSTQKRLTTLDATIGSAADMVGIGVIK